MEKTQFNEIASKMPGSFKSKLERIRCYLYLDSASVMVGAGFSRNADVPSHIEVKQWTDVGKDIYCRLQSVSDPDSSELVFKTPMRLASQFAASFGRSELDKLIRDAIPDDRMYPSSLHKQLLSLPWRDIFTTNYDTLLERGCDGLVRTYSIVTSKEMLLYKRSPRIVKLHGSFPDKTPFLMTEEDFRTYPSDHPEFVNTVRQALVESIFCLIGFSGDDPNFTSWQGWLRDVMGDYAGPSYMITCDAHFDDSFKKLMEHRGIEVLNLQELNGIDDYQTALDFFFTYLSKRETEWEGIASYSARDVDLKGLTAQLKEIRLAYPGWHMLPRKYYYQFHDMENTFPYLDNKINDADNKTKEDLLYELDWRADLSLTFKDYDWYRESLETIVAGYADNPLSEEAITLGLSLLRLYRHHPEKEDKAKTLHERLGREQIRMNGYQESRFHYVVACNALSVLDYETVQKELTMWHPSQSCYQGAIYKALVYAECGDLSAATKLLNDGIERVTQSLSQNTTIEELTLRHTMECLLAFYSGKVMPEAEGFDSFIDIRDAILRDVNKPLTDEFEINHGYGIGSESRTWYLGSGVNKSLLYPYRCLLLYENFGLPFGMAEQTVDEKIFTRLLPQLTGFGLWYSFGVMLRCGSRNVTTAYTSRSMLNTLPRKDADALADRMLVAVSQTSCEKALKHRATDVLLPFLARLATCCSQEMVARIFRFALSTYRAMYFTKSEDMSLIYASILPENVQDVFAELYSSDILCDIRDHDLPLPSRGYEFYKPGEREVEVVCKALESPNLKEQESAYYRAEKLLNSQLTGLLKERLEASIRLWRSKLHPTCLTRHSFTIVAFSDEEQKGWTEQCKEDVKSFVEGDYTFAGTSIPVSTLSDRLHILSVIAIFLDEAQRGAVLEKVTAALEANFDKFSCDDSAEMMGGMRHFTCGVFKHLQNLVKVIIKTGYDDRRTSGELFKVLEKYLPTHLRVRMTMEMLNTVSRTLGPNKMRDTITEHLFSENEEDVVDCCNALISFSLHGKNIQKVLQHIIFYCSHAESDRMRLYLQMLSLIPFEHMTKATRENLSKMMEQILERVPKQNFSEERKADIMHDGVVLAASLKGVASETPVEAAILKWADYASSEATYNDIRQPWFFKEDD